MYCLLIRDVQADTTQEEIRKMKKNSAVTRSIMAGLTIVTGLALTTPAALAKIDPPKKTCIINILGIKVCIKGLA